MPNEWQKGTGKGWWGQPGQGMSCRLPGFTVGRQCFVQVWELHGVLLLTVHLLQSPGLSAALLPAVTTQSVKSSPFLLKMS